MKSYYLSEVQRQTWEDLSGEEMYLMFQSTVDEPAVLSSRGVSILIETDLRAR